MGNYNENLKSTSKKAYVDKSAIEIALSCFSGGPVVKNLAANAETGVPSLGREDPLEEEMASYSSILA